MLIVQNPLEPASIRNAIVDLITPDVVDLRVASAYVTYSGCEILFNALCQKLGTEAFNAMNKTLISCFDFGLTEPHALRTWLNLPNATVYVAGAARLAQGSLLPTRAFHPKLYMFGKNFGCSSLLIASANLTGRGLSINTESAWRQDNILTGDVNAAFLKAQVDTVQLTEELLTHYENLRQFRPPPPEIGVEIMPVDPPAPIFLEDLQPFRVAIENNNVDPAYFSSMWVQGEALQGGSGNQLELPRGAHRFFGYFFNQYDYPDKIDIGQPVLRAGAHVWEDRQLTWHGNNRMERLNLPTLRQGGFNYSDTAVMFRRLNDGSYELIVTPWDSDLARSWREASARRQTLFRLGAIATNRTVGLL